MEEDLRSGIETLKDIAEGAVPPEISIEEAKAILKRYKELEEYYEEQNEVNAKFIPISVIQNTLKEIHNRNYNDYTNNQDGNEVKNNILKDIQELIEDGEK